jgi:hypothetical protein
MKPAILFLACICCSTYTYAQRGSPGEGDSALSKENYSLLSDSIPKKVSAQFSISYLLALPDSININRSKILFNSPYKYHFKNSFSPSEKWEGIISAAGYTLLSFIGEKNNFIYNFPQK